MYYDFYINTYFSGLESKNEIIWKKALLQTHDALSKKALNPIETKIEYLTKNDLICELRHITLKHLKKSVVFGPKQNPFNPWEKNLEIVRVKENHILILNKYPVEKGHMLLISKEWKPQNTLIDLDDWLALTAVEKDTGGLWFFNSCEQAGASQPHRHLQLLRREIGTKYCPREQWFLDKIQPSTGRDRLDKSILVFERKNYRTNNSANELYELYSKLCKETKTVYLESEECRLAPYNLIITNKWIALIKRSKEGYMGFSVNALGFAGYLLATNESNVNWLRINSIEDLLSSVICPYIS